jgi:PPOX class probable FMN-dependent enzyme
MTKADPYQIKTMEELRTLYDLPSPLVVKSKIDLLHDHMLHFMRLAPLVAIASDSDAGLDCSPRGGEPGFVKAIDRRTIAFADWPGNNKLETFSNVIASGRMGILFIAPRLDIFMRVNGDAIVTRDPAVLESLKEKDKTPKAAVRVSVREAYFHCGKAFRRSNVWKPERWPDVSQFPSVGRVLTDLTRVSDLTPEALTEFYYRELEEKLY